jgi:negative regulator of flagellin synthesis FlgM
MSPQIQPRLNHRFILRYDTPHAVVSDEDNSDWAEIEDLLAGGSDHMDVNSIGSVGRAAPLSGARPAQGVESSAGADALAPQDEVQISSEACKLDELSRTSGVRQERIEQIRQEIADGSYDTPEKLDAALDKFLDKYGMSDE